MGVDITSAAPNWPKIQARKDAIVAGFRKGLTGLIQSHKAKILQGRAVVTAPNQIKLETDSSPTEIQAGKIILATGSEPIQIPTIPFDGQTMRSRDLFQWRTNGSADLWNVNSKNSASIRTPARK